ncbi:MAG: SDR family NAD(P)-dependent oxidoreductase [Acidimicrobiales bacterium]
MVLTRELLPRLQAGDDAVVLNITSQLGSMEVAKSGGSDTPYCISKAALNMLSVKTAAALKTDGIVVVMLHPGWVQTDMGGAAAQLTMDESASAIVDTLSQLTMADSGRFITWDNRTHPW